MYMEITIFHSEAQRPSGRNRSARLALLALTELAVVVGDLILVALRHLLAARTAHAAGAVGVFHLAAQFHFHLLDAAHQCGLYALGQQGIVGVGVGVEALHVADQVLQILDHGGIVALRLLPGRDPREKVYLAVKQITSAPSHTAHSPRPSFRE